MKRISIILLALLFTVGCSAAPSVDVDAIRQEGYDEGYLIGYNTGSSDGYIIGSSDGYAKGINDTLNAMQIAIPTPSSTEIPQIPPVTQEIVPVQTAAPTEAYIDASSLNLRAEPNGDAEILAEIDGGSTVGITGESGEWYAVTVNGQSGYMLKEYVAIGQPS